MEITLNTEYGTLTGHLRANNQHNKMPCPDNPYVLTLTGIVKVGRTEYQARIELRQGEWNHGDNLVGYTPGPFWGLRSFEELSLNRTDKKEVPWNPKPRANFLNVVVQAWKAILTNSMLQHATEEHRINEMQSLLETIARLRQEVKDAETQFKIMGKEAEKHNIAKLTNDLVWHLSSL